VTTPQVPAYLLNTGVPDFTDRLGANLGTRAQPYLSIKDDRLTLVDTSGNKRPIMTRDAQTGDPYIDCVIIDTCDHESKIYYGRDYDPKAETSSPPACWSDNGVAPSTNCGEPQAVSCSPDPFGINGCKWAVWGSGRAAPGSKTVPPACNKVQKIALLIPGEEIQFLLRVPPNSLVELANYNGKFKGHKFSIPDVTTRISLRDKTLFFAGLGYIDEATAKLRNQILLAHKTDALVGRGDKPRQAALPAPTNPVPVASLPASAPAEPPDPLFAQPSIPSGTTPAIPASAAVTAAPPTRRRGRPPKDAVPAPQTNGSETPPASFPHGMTQAPEPNADLEASLKSVFG
jgi:hypothetical protein